MERDPSFGYQNIEIEFAEGTFDLVWQRLKGIGKQSTVFSFRSPYRYNSSLQISEIVATDEIRLNNYGASTAASLDQKMELNYRRLLAKFRNYMDAEDVKPSDARMKIIGDLNSSIANCLDLEISSIGNVEDGSGTLFFKKQDHPKEFDFNVLSSGEKEVVDLLLDLYLRKDDYDDTVFLLDEPELHINSAIQRKLLIEIDRLVGANCQIWITTHSIGFLRALQSEMKGRCQIVQFRTEDDLASQPQTLRPIKMTPAAWRNLFEVALDDLAALVSPETLVYCEGRAEPGKLGAERGMDAHVYNTVFGDAHPNTLFISSGGNTELDQRSAVALAILSKVFPHLEILILKDRDMASGKGTDEKDRQVYLRTNPRSHRVLKRWEIENYLYDKDVLKAFCAAQSLTFDEASYDAFVIDIENQNLKDETGRMRNFCGIKGSVSADAFKVSLAEHLVKGMPAYEELEHCVFKRG
jgi:hypothetical protein